MYCVHVYMEVYVIHVLVNGTKLDANLWDISKKNIFSTATCMTRSTFEFVSKEVKKRTLLIKPKTC